ncbi:type IV pilin [Natronomonas gomsonensis]|uniref:type IV pilin n=1 Tax=Natronomonas gomsonensis TaxID=1046043 RepID=UPI0015BFDDF9|nr:type IV pilin [Natronomonas gomsonensis]
MGVRFRPSKRLEDTESFGYDNRAIAPAVGILLLVGIVLVLAASTGAFVLDDRNQPEESSPVAVFDFEYQPGDRRSGDELTVTHVRGDTIAGERLDLRIRNARYEEERFSHEADASRKPSTSFFGTESVTAGDSTTVTTGDFRRGLGVGLVGDQDFDLSKAEVCVVWQTDGSGPETLTCWRGPDTKGFVE